MHTEYSAVEILRQLQDHSAVRVRPHRWPEATDSTDKSPLRGLKKPERAFTWFSAVCFQRTAIAGQATIL